MQQSLSVLFNRLADALQRVPRSSSGVSTLTSLRFENFPLHLRYIAFMVVSLQIELFESCWQKMLATECFPFVRFFRFNFPMALDHLIFRVDDLVEATAQWQQCGFNVVQGGKHADGISGNALIILADGVYIELFTFLTDQHQEHWWAQKQPGWIDLALTPKDETSEEFVNRINSQPGSLVKYKQPQRGGRETLDDPPKLLEWKVTFVDSPSTERGRVPFLCEDLTPRDWRVPERHAKHENKASGIQSITLLTAPDQLDHYVSTLECVFGKADSSKTSPESRTFTLLSPNSKNSVQVQVKNAKTPAEKQWWRNNGEGLYEITLHGQSNQELMPGVSLVSL